MFHNELKITCFRIRLIWCTCVSWCSCVAKRVYLGVFDNALKITCFRMRLIWSTCVSWRSCVAKRVYFGVFDNAMKITCFRMRLTWSTCRWGLEKALASWSSPVTSWASTSTTCSYVPRPPVRRKRCISVRVWAARTRSPRDSSTSLKRKPTTPARYVRVYALLANASLEKMATRMELRQNCRSDFLPIEPWVVILLQYTTYYKRPIQRQIKFSCSLTNASLWTITQIGFSAI